MLKLFFYIILFLQINTNLFASTAAELEKKIWSFLIANAADLNSLNTLDLMRLKLESTIDQMKVNCLSPSENCKQSMGQFLSEQKVFQKSMSSFATSTTHNAEQISLISDCVSALEKSNFLVAVLFFTFFSFRHLQHFHANSDFAKTPFCK
jgi:hypothetical protein